MKTDLYTKVILTVIALCLSLNILKEFDIIPTVQAKESVSVPAPAPQAVQSGTVDVNIVSVSGSSVWSDGLPVHVKNTVDVRQK